MTPIFRVVNMETWTNDRGRLVDLTDGEAFIMQWQKGMLGGFMNALALAMARADPENLTRLERSFPEEAQAMREWREGDLHSRLSDKGFLL